MRKSLSSLHKSFAAGTQLACLTAYDASQAYWAAQAGVDVLLVGDSLGMVVQGHATTLPVSLDDMVYHTQLVQRGNLQAQTSAYCIADLPFLADATVEQAFHAAGRLMKEGGANMIKLEGAQRAVPIVRALAQSGVPICGHLGLLPQSVEKQGYKVQGKDVESARHLMESAIALQEAGADMLVLECVPVALAQRITERLQIPVIGIGSGGGLSGQVLVLHDVLGVTLGKAPKFSQNFMQGQSSIQGALAAYVRSVKEQTFPDKSHWVAQ